MLHEPALNKRVSTAFGAVLGCAQPRNVIFDTDVGTDFDDTASIAYALMNPNITVRGASCMPLDMRGRCA